MKLTDREVKLFKDLHGTELGRVLVDYFERLKVDLFNPSVITKDNFESRKEALEILEKEFIQRIKLVNPEKEVSPNQFV